MKFYSTTHQLEEKQYQVQMTSFCSYRRTKVKSRHSGDQNSWTKIVSDVEQIQHHFVRDSAPYKKKGITTIQWLLFSWFLIHTLFNLYVMHTYITTNFSIWFKSFLPLQFDPWSIKKTQWNTAHMLQLNFKNVSISQVIRNRITTGPLATDHQRPHSGHHHLLRTGKQYFNLSTGFGQKTIHN